MPTINPNEMMSERPPGGVGPGSYTARIVSCEIRESKSGESNYLNWKFETLDHGKWFFLRTGFYGKGLEKLKEVVVAATGMPYDGGELVTESLIGRELMITVGKEKPDDQYMAVLAVQKPEDIPF